MNIRDTILKKKLTPFVSKDEFRPILNCIFEEDETGLMVACDAYRMAIYSPKEENFKGRLYEIPLVQKGIIHVVTKKKITGATDDTYVNFRLVFPFNNRYSVAFDKKAVLEFLKNALAKMPLVCYKSRHLSNCFVFLSKDKYGDLRIELRMNLQEEMETETFPASKAWDGLDGHECAILKINAKYFAEALKALDAPVAVMHFGSRANDFIYLKEPHYVHVIYTERE